MRQAVLFSMACLLSMVSAASAQSTRPADVTRAPGSIFDFGRDPLNDASGRKPSQSPTTRPAIHPDDAKKGGSGVDGAKPFILQIDATIDGSDVLVLSAQGAEWTHKHWGWAKDVMLNDVAWQPKDQPTLPSTGELQFLTTVDFSKAKVLDRQGRDTVAMEREDDRLTIYFADSPGGAGEYQIKILLPAK